MLKFWPGYDINSLDQCVASLGITYKKDCTRIPASQTRVEHAIRDVQKYGVF